MTTEPIIEPTQSTEDSPPPIEPSEPNPILGEITRLNQDEGTADTQPSDDAEVNDQVQPGAAPSPEPVSEVPATETQIPTGQVPQAPQYSPDQIQRMEFEARQHQEEQARAAIQSQTNTYRQQLEQQGFLPEHAEQAASYYMQTQEYQSRLVKQVDEYAQHLQGQTAAAEHFVKRYNLGIDDLTTLRAYNDPQTMEQAAKKLSGDRERDTELTRLRQAQVPAQQFDNSQGEPSVASNDSGWLDRYNSGDRSPNSVAAARRATGLE